MDTADKHKKENEDLCEESQPVGPSNHKSCKRWARDLCQQRKATALNKVCQPEQHQVPPLSLSTLPAFDDQVSWYLEQWHVM